jgi:hypothetical protein
MGFIGYVSGNLSTVDVTTAVNAQLRAGNDETGDVLLWAYCKLVV